MVGHVNNDNNNGGPGGNLPALKGVASMSSANYLRKSVSCQRIDEILKDSMDALPSRRTFSQSFAQNETGRFREA